MRPVVFSAVFLLLATPVFSQIDRDVGRLYTEFCAGCHGPDMAGGKAGSLLDPVWRNGGDDQSIERSIREGMPESGMPGFGRTFTAAELRGLVVLIKEKAHRTAKPELRGVIALPEGVQESGGQLYRIEPYVHGFDVPWSICFLGEREFLVSERPGRLRRVRNGELLPQPVEGIPAVWVRDEGGLMSVAVDPDYTRNGWIYLSFSDPGEDDTGMTKIVRGRIRDNHWVDQQTVFSTGPERYTNSGMGFGCRLVFDGPYLYFTIGERGKTGAAQDLSSPSGKVHRVYHDGSIPPDNPFVSHPLAWPSIWSVGNRNPQGLAVDPRDGSLWESEHGPRGGDELNFIQPGRNYGWPIVTHGMNYDGTPVSSLTEKEGLEAPAAHWTPSIAVCPVLVYTGDRFPHWSGQLFLGSLAQQEFLRFRISEGRVLSEERVFKNLGRVRDIQVGPDGLIYLAMETPGSPGRILRLLPAAK